MCMPSNRFEFQLSIFKNMIHNLFDFIKTFKIEIANAFWRCSSSPHLRIDSIPLRHLIIPRPMLRAMHKLSSSFTTGNMPLLGFSAFDSHFPSFEHAPNNRRLFLTFFPSFLSTKFHFYICPPPKIPNLHGQTADIFIFNADFNIRSLPPDCLANDSNSAVNVFGLFCFGSRRGMQNGVSICLV